MSDPFTMLQAVTTVGTTLIQVVPELIKVISERKQRSAQNKNDESQVEKERSQLQKELLNLQQSFQQEQLRKEKQVPEIYQYITQQKQLEQQLANYNRQVQLELAEHQRQTALQLPEVNKLFENWPLNIVPSQILNRSSKDTLSTISYPLRIFLSPPRVALDNNPTNEPKFHGKIAEIEPMLAQRLGDFLDRYYSLQNAERPSEFLGGAWHKDKRNLREAGIKALFSMLQSEATLILESEFIDANELAFRIGYWGVGQKRYCYQTIASIPYKEIMCNSAKNRALEWSKDRKRLIQQGKTLEEIEHIGGIYEINFKILNEEEQLKSAGINVLNLPIHYSYSLDSQDFEAFCRVLIACHCLIAAWIADSYHLLHHNIPPLLPKLIQETTNTNNTFQAIQPVMQGIVTSYQMLYESLTSERPSWMPELSLELATSLAHLPDKAWSRDQTYYSIKMWLQQRQVSPLEGIQALASLQSTVTLADREYIDELKKCFTAIQDQQALNKLFDINWTLQQKQRKLEENYQKGLEKNRIGNYQKAIEYFNQALLSDPNSAQAYFGRGHSYAQLKNYLYAIQDYTHTIQLKPNYVDAYVNRGLCHYNMSNNEASLEDFEKALALNPNLPQVIQYRDKINQTVMS